MRGGLHFRYQVETERSGVVTVSYDEPVDPIQFAVWEGVLLFDSSPDPVHAEPGEEWRPKPEPGRLELAVEAAAGTAGDMLRVARGAAGFALSPRRQATKLAETVTALCID